MEDKKSSEISPKRSTDMNIEKPPDEDSTEDKIALPDNEEYLSGFKAYIVLIAVTLASFLMLLDSTIIATTIPRVTSHFHSLHDVGWYGNTYLLANCSLQPLTGKLYTYLSSKYTFLTFLAVFELGSLICGVAQSSNMLIAGRAIAGLGGSGLQNGAMTIVSACVPLKKRPFMLGIMMAFAQIAIAVGPLMGGALTEYASWRWCFFINLPADAATSLLLLLIQIPKRTLKIPHTKTTLPTLLPKLDLLGFILFAPSAIQFLLALTWGGTIIGLFCGSFATFCLFLTWEYRQGDKAMFPFSMIKKRVVWCACLAQLFLMGSNFITSYYLPIYFQAVRDYRPMMCGVYTLPRILSIGKLGYYLPWSIASGALITIASGLFTTFTPATATAKWVGYQIIGGIGRACGMQMPLVALQTHLPLPSQISTSTTLLIFSQNFGGAIFLSISQVIFNSSLKSTLRKYASGVDAQAVIDAGASAFRYVVKDQGGNSVGDVVKAYCEAVVSEFWVPMAAGIGLVVVGWGLGWVDVRKKKGEVKGEREKEAGNDGESGGVV